MDAASYMALTADNFLEWKTVGERDTQTDNIVQDQVNGLHKTVLG